MADPSVERINALTQNARSTWFALLSVLLFVGITLMGVSDIDFYGVDRATQLPLINVSVPTRLFFYAAPVLTAAVYSYFHLYLIRLWGALAETPARIEGERLGDVVTPWLITDAALYVRRKIRKDNCASRRPLELAAATLNIAFAWSGGWVILGFVWLQSLPARSFLMTSIAAIAFIVVVWVGLTSLVMGWRNMSSKLPPHRISWWRRLENSPLLIAFIPVLLSFSYLRTNAPNEWPESLAFLAEAMGDKPSDWLAQLDLRSEEIVVKPKDWQPYEQARETFLDKWCKRATTPNCKAGDTAPESFEAAWDKQADLVVDGLQKPSWNKAEAKKPNFRDARLQNAFLAGTNLREADLQGANLRNADLQGANLWGADLQGANLWGALLISSIDNPMLLQDTDLSASINNGGALRSVDFSEATVNDQTDWRNAFLDASVTVPNSMRNRIGHPCLWNWLQENPEPLSSDSFFGRWRGWLKLDPEWGDLFWLDRAPPEYHDITPIPPPADCKWITDPLPGPAEN